MNYERILIRFGEISTKGRNRKIFVDKLKKNILRALAEYKEIEIEANRDRIYILLNGADWGKIAPILSTIFGIQSFSPGIKVALTIDEMKAAAVELVSKHFKKGKTFKITGKRADKSFELNTDEINHTFGSHLLKRIPGLKVDVNNPDINLQIEIRKEAAYLSCETIQGVGGLPVGSSGRAMLMLSGGLDSPVAGYLSMKRGLEVEAVHFYSPPFTSERARQKVIDLTEKLSKISGQITLHIVPFTELQQAIQQQVPENYTMTTTRRMMLRITDEIRRKREGLAIITGESLGQVASQTLESMFAINEVTNTPILRPLITMDKTDIMKIARDIDTHDISILPYEDCCTVFVPASPKTKPRRDKVAHYESYIDFEPYIQAAVLGTEMLHIGEAVNAKKREKEMNDLF